VSWQEATLLMDELQQQQTTAEADRVAWQRERAVMAAEIEVRPLPSAG
jgi:hypothetical protein